MDPSLLCLVAQGLREDASRRHFMMEQYDQDGEIVEAWESFTSEQGVRLDV